MRGTTARCCSKRRARRSSARFTSVSPSRRRSRPYRYGRAGACRPSISGGQPSRPSSPNNSRISIGNSMEEQDRIAVMQQFGRTYRAFMSAFEAHVGQPLPRWRILLALHEQAGESSQKRLVERLRVDPGALTRQLKTLEGLGWIARSMDTRDNRVTNVRLTEAGMAATA